MKKLSILILTLALFLVLAGSVTAAPSSHYTGVGLTEALTYQEFTWNNSIGGKNNLPYREYVQYTLPGRVYCDLSWSRSTCDLSLNVSEMPSGVSYFSDSSTPDNKHEIVDFTTDGTGIHILIHAKTGATSYSIYIFNGIL